MFLFQKMKKMRCTLLFYLHDIGHGPFSHAMEHSIVEDVHHEEISLLFMNKLNEEFDGKLALAIQIFKGEYHRKFMYAIDFKSVGYG
jgi:HD superfamily phosphohydrolase